MKISIGCTQRFDVTVTKEIVDVLTTLGQAHYDGVCKSAVSHGGFIYGWHTRMYFVLEQEDEEKTFVCSIDNGQLQTCLKICENSPSLLTPAQKLVQRSIITMGFEALEQASRDRRFLFSAPVPSAGDPREVEIAKLREENSRLYAQAVALLYFVPGDTLCGDIQEVRAKYDEWLKWLTTSKSLVHCKLDTDGDGNCPIHPDGCPTSAKPA